MRSNISPKAKRLTGWMALTAAVCTGTLAVAVVLFFEVWWAGLIALAVSMLCGVATVLLFMAYQADRRRSMRATEEEEEDKRVMALLENARSQREMKEVEAEEGSVVKDNISETPPEKEETNEENSSVSDTENLTKEDEERVHADSDDAQKPTTLEMRPPLKLLTVEEAKAHMKGGDKKSENDSQNDKNED